jgi:hypothetical protein
MSHSSRSLAFRFALCSALSLFLMGVAHAQPLAFAPTSSSLLCQDGECRPAISKTTFFDRPAYSLTDGRTQAIVVPEIGRIMSYGKVGGPNLLWNAPTAKGIDWGWKNYGGDKNWLAPQSAWPATQGKGWPPDPAFDGQPHQLEVLSGGRLQLTSSLSASSGMRFIRTLYYADNGDLVIEQTVCKEKGAPLQASIWNITQTAPGQAVFLPMNLGSNYKGGFVQLQGKEGTGSFEAVKPNLLRVLPTQEGGGLKIGVDSSVSSIASVRDGVAFLQKAPKPIGTYPDGVEGAGFPVEFYIYSNPKLFYYEMELLGPMKTFKPGGKSTHTMRWSLHDLPSQDVNSPEVVEVVEKLLFAQ